MRPHCHIAFRFRSALVSALAALLLLSGCGGAGGVKSPPSQQGGQTPTGTVQTYPVPAENIRATYCSFAPAHAPRAEGGYYFILGSSVSYGKLGSKSIPMCSQPTCDHNGTYCPAYIGKVSYFAEYQGNWYYLREDSGGVQYALVRHEPSTTNRTVLVSWFAQDGENILPSFSLISHGYAYVYVSHAAFDAATGQYDEWDDYVRVDTDSGQIQDLPVLGAVVGASDAHLVTIETEFVPDAFDYLRAELRRYDTKTWEYETVASLSDEEKTFWPTVDYHVCYGNQVIYQGRDTLYLLDIETGVQRELLTRKGIANYFLFDNKAFFLTRDAEGAYSIFYAPLDTGEPVQLKNEGETRGMVFGIQEEGSDYFVGLYGSEIPVVLSKDNFYAERYDQHN